MTSTVRFDIQPDDLADENNQHAAQPVVDLVADVQERRPTAPTAPSFPSLTSKTGFPSHTKRKILPKARDRTQEDAADMVSQGSKAITSAQSTHTGSDLKSSAAQATASDDREQISRENEHRIASMSADEIAEARKEIMSALEPDLLQRLLRRSDITSGSNEAESIHDTPNVTHITRQPLKAGAKIDLDDDEPQTMSKLFDNPVTTLPGGGDTIHFPRAPQPPDLDPSSDTFLEDLHSKYFPDLPADPDKLEWMRTSTTAQHSYHPSQAAVKPADIRFDFKGSLIPPSRALAIPVSAGLHHHGDAPEAAGYTIPELAHLLRSTYAPQRCIASQTLGRVLYKLGKGDFGDPGEPGADTVGAEDTFGELARGLWREVESQHVIPLLVAEEQGNGIDGGRHWSARAYATEAIWLWQRGGGRRWNTS